MIISKIRHTFDAKALLGRNIFICVFVLWLFVFFFFVFKGWNGSLLEEHGFRQTQTAISVYYMLKGGSLIQYQTPILGLPWSIPMEFPFYQYIVYLLVKLTGYSLDQSGRLVSLFFFIFALYPFYHLIKPFFYNNSRVFIALLLLMMSPQYIFWTRTFMIESTALSLSLWYLYFIKKYLDDHNVQNNTIIYLLCIAIIGTLASVTKVTTFFVYYVGGSILFLLELYNTYKNRTLRVLSKKNLTLSFVAFVLPLVSIIVWTLYSDYVKSFNPIGTDLKSSSLKVWNFGTMEQKLTFSTWWTIIKRSVFDLAGISFIFLFLPLCRKQTIVVSLLLLGLFLLPISVFTNLYYVHTYYLYANGIFLLAAAALVIGDVSARGKAGIIITTSILIVLAVTFTIRYTRHYLPMQGNGYRFQEIKRDINTYTRPDEVMVISGADWSSEMPYYLERRSLMLPNWITVTKYQKARDLLKPYRVGAVIVCNDEKNHKETTEQILGDFNFTGNVKKISYKKYDAYYRERKVQN